METAEDLDRVLDEAADVVPGHGVSAVELVSPTGAALVVAQVGGGIVLAWVDAFGHSMHSVGSAAAQGTVVFGYSDQHTEVPAGFVVPAGIGRAAALEFVVAGAPFVPGLVLEPD
ncbi:Imm1 family immunity protein [Jiangella anatolica]|uniref:Imm1 family immunity protein n=1 Tax=Jiangella anatolica TaxID=2670374 RepID=UPI001314444E|nr:Imm1 family immunity protein [Jiangella anatolica]